MNIMSQPIGNSINNFNSLLVELKRTLLDVLADPQFLKFPKTEKEPYSIYWCYQIISELNC